MCLAKASICAFLLLHWMTLGAKNAESQAGVPSAASQNANDAGNAKGAKASDSGRITAYDTVSVRQNKSATRNSSLHPSPNGLILTNFDLQQIMLLAFGPSDPRLISGLPAWSNSTRFDIEAKLDDETFATLQKLPAEEARDSRKKMLQQILFDRFKLKLRNEKKDVPVYALVVASGGPKFKETNPEANAADPTIHPGQILAHDGELSGHAIAIDRLARNLSGMLDRQVVNQTGLTGSYDVALKWLPVHDSQANPEADRDSSLTSLLTAIHEQLGLKIESTHALADVVVVDHIEMPNDN
jgi:uncharacterized protein (TIGR03435 family)